MFCVVLIRLARRVDGRDSGMIRRHNSMEKTMELQRLRFDKEHVFEKFKCQRLTINSKPMKIVVTGTATRGAAVLFG